MQAAGQDDLFGIAETAPTVPAVGVIPEGVDEWDDDQRLSGEKETLGLFLTGHPIDFYRDELKALAESPIAALSLDELRGAPGRRGGKKVTIGGMVVAISRRNTQRGPMASVLLDDKSGRIEATLFNEVYERHRDDIANDRVLLVEGTLVPDEYRGGLGLRADRVSVLEQVRVERAETLELRIDETALKQVHCSAETLLQQMQSAFDTARGGDCEVRLRYCRADSEAELRCGKDWRIKPTDPLLRQLRRLPAVDAVTLRFRPASRTPATNYGYARSM
jgi:DNA polymerase-3 subunit alpha